MGRLWGSCVTGGGHPAAAHQAGIKQGLVGEVPAAGVRDGTSTSKGKPMYLGI